MDRGKRRMLKRDNATKALLESRTSVSFTNTKHPNDISDTYETIPVLISCVFVMQYGGTGVAEPVSQIHFQVQ